MIAASSINCVGFNLPFSTTRINIGDLMEARVGIEPTHKGFADLSLTTWVPRPEIKVSPESGIVYQFSGDSLPQQNALLGRAPEQYLERETGFEPATSTLARS